MDKEREALVERLRQWAGNKDMKRIFPVVSADLYRIADDIAAMAAQQEPVAWAEVDSEGRSIAAYLPGEKEQVEAEYGGVFRPLVYGDTAPLPKGE